MKVVAENTDGPHLAPSTAASANVNRLGSTPDLEQEVDAMLADLCQVDLDLPDEVLRLCTAYMGRCTELHIQIIRVEGTNRALKWFRTQQLTKLMELVEFTYRAASRIVEIRRQDTELSR